MYLCDFMTFEDGQRFFISADLRTTRVRIEPVPNEVFRAVHQEHLVYRGDGELPNGRLPKISSGGVGMSTISYRLPMPLVDVDQNFATAAELEVVLTSLYKRAVWFLSRGRGRRSTKNTAISAHTSGPWRRTRNTSLTSSSRSAVTLSRPFRRTLYMCRSKAPGSCATSKPRSKATPGSQRFS